MQPHDPSIGSPIFYAVFALTVIIMIAIDMLSLKKQGVHKVTMREALIWSVVWVGVSVLFGLGLYWHLSTEPAYGAVVAKTKVMEFFTAYVLEKSLAVDNIFVFLMIFAFFKVPPAYQHRVLLYGVFGAIVLRSVMIGVGAVLVREFAWILYVFGVFLIITGIKMLFHKDDDAEDLSDNRLLKLLQRLIPVSNDFDREKFFTVQNGKRLATPLFLVVVMVELSDVIFAVDSIPAVFAVSTDPFIVLTSNIFAILGLRAMFFLLADFADRFVFLQYGLAVVLTFIGVKMLIAHWFPIPISISLAVVFAALAVSVLISLLYQRKQSR